MKIKTVPTVKYEVIWENGDVCHYDSLDVLGGVLSRQVEHWTRQVDHATDQLKKCQLELVEAKHRLAHAAAFAKQEKVDGQV